MIKKWDNFNENIAYAKSVLGKQGITAESPEYQDYLKIREICGNDNGYVGILTKLRFVDNVTDMDEIKSIYDVLKKSKFDFAKLNKLTYDEILELFYDELSGDKVSKEDIELIFRDDSYSYYRVYTHKGILEIGSPAWCLKTKSNWDKYQAVYPEQWVAIDNRYKSKLLSPNDNYLSEYKSGKGYVRFGISLKHNDDNTISWKAFSDNNYDMEFSPSNWTFFGVMSTVLNLTSGFKKSYHKKFMGCEHYQGSNAWFKVTDKDLFYDRMKMKWEHGIRGVYDGDKELYLYLSESYSSVPLIFKLGESLPSFLYPTNSVKFEKEFINLTGASVRKIFKDYASSSDSDIYAGVKIKLNKMTIEDVEKQENYIKKIGKWLVFNRNDKFYLLVNSEVNEYQLPVSTYVDDDWNMTDPLFWFLEKETGKAYKVDGKSYTTEVINDLIKKKEPRNKGMLKKFRNIFRKKEEE